MRRFPCPEGIAGDLLEILSDRIRTVWQPLDPGGVIPLASQPTDALREIVAAHARRGGSGKLIHPQGQVLWDDETKPISGSSGCERRTRTSASTYLN